MAQLVNTQMNKIEHKMRQVDEIQQWLAEKKGEVDVVRIRTTNQEKKKACLRAVLSNLHNTELIRTNTRDARAGVPEALRGEG